MAGGPGGDVEAAVELYDRYAGQVYGVARRIVGNETDAEDVVQEACTSQVITFW
jgi:DNA-directed RNA polymerase specialized sigma24 family protein